MSGNIFKTDDWQMLLDKLDEMIKYQKETIEMVKNWTPETPADIHESQEENNAMERPEIYN